MKVCVSFNGVIANTALALVEQIKKDHGIVIPPAEFSKKSVGCLFPNVVEDGLPKVLSKAGYAQSKRNLFETEAFQWLEPVAGAVEGLELLGREGAELVIVTDAKTVTRERVAAWLPRNGFAHDLEVIFTRKGRRDREPHQCKCQVVVDDNVERLFALRGRTGMVLVHFTPELGSAGSGAAQLYLGTNDTDGSEITSIRGWSELTPLLLAHLEDFRSTAQAA